MKQALKMGLHESKGKQSFLCALICVVVRGWKFRFINEKHGQAFRRFGQRAKCMLGKAAAL